MFVNDIFKKKLNETVLNPRDPQGDYDAKRKVIHDLSLDPAVDQQAVQRRRLDLDKEAKAKGLKEQDVKEGGPFSYGAKKPRKGSVADLAAQKRREQEKGKQPIEPKDQRVGVARVVKEFAPSGGGGGRWYSDDQLYDIIGEDWLEAFDVSGDQGNIDLRGERARLFLAQEAEAWLTDRGYRVNVLDVKDDGDELSWYIQGPLYRGLAEGSGVTKLNDYDTWLDRVDALGAGKHVQKNRTLIVAQSWDGEKVGEFDTSSNQGWVMKQGVAEDFDDLDRFMKDKYGPQPRGGSGIKTGTYGSPRRKRGRPTGAESLSGGSDIPHAVDFDRPHSERSAGRKLPRFSDDYDAIKRSEVDEGSAQDKLYKRHQELRKKSGLPDPDYYKELKASYDLPDQDRYAKQKEIKQKYKVTNEDREQYIEELGRAGYEIITEKRMTCPECGGAAYSDRMLAEKQDACYHKVKSRYKVWPSAYASGALVQCRKKGAANWGNKKK